MKRIPYTAHAFAGTEWTTKNGATTVEFKSHEDGSIVVWFWAGKANPRITGAISTRGLSGAVPRASYVDPSSDLMKLARRVAMGDCPPEPFLDELLVRFPEFAPIVKELLCL